MSTKTLKGLLNPIALGVGMTVALAPPIRAQGPKLKATPAAAKPSPGVNPASAAAAGSPATPAARTITVTFARPGAYDYWTVGRSGPGPILTSTAGATSIPVTTSTDTTAIDVLDGGTGLVATLDVTKSPAAVTVSPNDFSLLHTVKVTVTGKGGLSVEKAQVTLTDAAGKITSKVLTADDAGAVQFNDVPLGKASIAAVYAANGAKTSTDVTLAPTRGGGPVPVTVALPGDVPTISAAATPSPTPAAPTVVNVAAGPAPAAEPPANNWFAGFAGIVVLAILGFFGIRAARARGITVESLVKQLGVDTSVASPAAGLAPPKAAPAPLPPLPSLSDLPSAGPAPRAATAFAGGVASVAAVGPPRITGVAGPASGESFDLDAAAPLTIGRDIANTLSLAQDTAVSRRHARFERGPGGWQVADDGSSNGTFVNGARVGPAPRPLRAGDEIQIGGSRFRFEGA